MTLVVDASVACKWFVDEVGSDDAATVLQRSEILVAPDLIIPEVCNALWRKRRAGEVRDEQAEAAVRDLTGFFDELVPGGRLSARAFALAVRLDHPVYDCFYLALAELRGAPLVTADQRLVERLADSDWRTTVTSVRDRAAEA